MSQPHLTMHLRTNSKRCQLRYTHKNTSFFLNIIVLEQPVSCASLVVYEMTVFIKCHFYPSGCCEHEHVFRLFEQLNLC